MVEAEVDLVGVFAEQRSADLEQKNYIVSAWDQMRQRRLAYLLKRLNIRDTRIG